MERRERGEGVGGGRWKDTQSSWRRRQEMGETDPIVSRPTSTRREINRAVYIHRRIFRRLSLQDGGRDCSCMIDTPIRTSASLRATIYDILVSLVKLSLLLYSTSIYLSRSCEAVNIAGMNFNEYQSTTISCTRCKLFVKNSFSRSLTSRFFFF